MRLTTVHSAVLAITLIVLAGCQKQGPVELVTESTRSQELEIENNGQSSVPGFDGADIDSMLPPLVEGKTYGQLIISGGTYESAAEHHEVAFARAVFFRTEAPLVVDRDTLFRTVGVGSLNIDGIPLTMVSKLAPMNTTDTLGVQYLLASRDGLGGKGFAYTPNYLYKWDASGYGVVNAFSVSLLSPGKIHVISPTVEDVVRMDQNLRVRWEGETSPVTIIISEYRGPMTPRPIFKMKVNVNRGGVLIPSTVLSLLPRDRAQFLFSFVTVRKAFTQIGGFRDPVLVQINYSHNLLLRVSR